MRTLKNSFKIKFFNFRVSIRLLLSGRQSHLAEHKEKITFAKKVIFSKSSISKTALLIIIFLLVISIIYAQVPDSDRDFVPNSKDKCPDTPTSIAIDQFGCSCEQKIAADCSTRFPGATCCVADNNPCTDDCGLVNNLVSCNIPKQCAGGICEGGRCLAPTTLNPNLEALSVNPQLVQLGLQIQQLTISFMNPSNHDFCAFRYKLPDTNSWSNAITTDCEPYTLTISNTATAGTYEIQGSACRKDGICSQPYKTAYVTIKSVPALGTIFNINSNQDSLLISKGDGLNYDYYLPGTTSKNWIRGN